MSGRLVRERIGPAMLSAVQSQVLSWVSSPLLNAFVYYTTPKSKSFRHVIQMGAVESSFEDIQNIFDTGGCKGLPGDSVEKIPKIRITTNNNVDGSGERVCCSVCLQV